MKLRWREQEIILVSILAIAQIVISLAGRYAFSSRGLEEQILTQFRQNGIPFNYFKNFIVPQVGSIVLMYGTYLLVNLVIITAAKKIRLQHIEKILSWKLLFPLISFLVAAYLLAIGTNALSYYGRPDLVNYREYRLLSLLGYNDQPLNNPFFGFDRALGVVSLLTVLAALRETIIWLIEKEDGRREFRVSFVNTGTTLLFFYILTLLLFDSGPGNLQDYIAWTTPVLGLFLYNIYVLFPYIEHFHWYQKPCLLRLLTSSTVGSLFATVVYGGSNKMLHFSLYWLLLVLILTPLCWIIYQYRRDGVLQLKGLQKDLARRTSDLQFLRSQINPHFLFNALNTLHGTAWKEGSEQTAVGIQMLGDMMRFMLQENNLDAIPMEKELGYLRNYIALQKMRIPGNANIVVEDNIEEARCQRQIAPMLLIPFVENAFKHGIRFEEKSWVSIDLNCENDRIVFEVRNSLHPGRADNMEKDHSGIGLKNVKERLRILYPGQYSLKLTETEAEFVATLIIN
ncbi:sensor histidine kinase [Flavihumibacter solisilvae]|uniref:sensor histidine kinase n=1 Tax=Flavihumibacter solisilvae TaxID=1349421 RepID=UPI00069030E3|nr:histidine kinase [Flavihumibacter solisilvae]